MVKSLPVVRQKLRLDSLNVIKTYERTFRRIDWFFYLSDVLVRVRGRASRQFSDEINAVIALFNDLVGGAGNDLNKYCDEANKRLSGNTDTVKLVYNNPVTVSVEARTPLAMRYVELLKQQNTLATSIDLSWFLGLINADQQLSEQQRAHILLLSMTNKVSVLARGVASRVTNDADAGAVPLNYMSLLKGESDPLTDDLKPDQDQMTGVEADEIQHAEALANKLSNTVIDSLSHTLPGVSHG